MLNKCLIGFGVLLIGATSCSVQKHLPEGTFLYNGASVKITKTSDYTAGTRTLKKSLQGITFPKKNRMILGYPYKVGIWYAMGEPRRKTGLKSWLKNWLGEPPELSSTLKLKSNEENILAYVENRGHFKSGVSSSTTTKGYKMNVLYDVVLARPYMIDSVGWTLDSSMISRDILTIDQKANLVKPNEQFNLENVKAEARRTDLELKTKGYYYFNPDYIKTYLDTSIGDHKANLFFSIRPQIPVLAQVPQTIESVVLFPNYTLIYPPPDTSKTGLVEYKGIFIRDTVRQFKPSALVNSITYKPGSLYNLEVHNETLNRFIKMGAFRFVKSRYEPSGDSAGLSGLNVFYYLTPLKRKSLNAELGGFSKSNSFTGAQVNLNWKNRNVFGGAEQLNVKTFGAIETSSVDTLRKNNNWRVGGELSFIIPRFVAPFKIPESNYAPPFTRFTLGYEWMRRQLLYTKNFFRFQYDLSWKQKNGTEHVFAPLSITFNNTTQFSEEYLRKISQYPVLQYANKPELLLGMFYNFTYLDRGTSKKNIFYFNGNIDIAGNIAGLLNKPDTAFSKKIAGAYFAQYIKLEMDARYTMKLARKAEWANRLVIGMSAPYGNSAYLPFSKQFIIGGANSLRGFRPRQLGPGTVLTSADQQITYPQIGGDYKLELQTEYRFPLTGMLYGAVFAEAGNIWTKTDLLYGAQGKFDGSFLNNIAVDAGVGLRIDVNVLIIRLDLAVPLKKPWLVPANQWVINDINFSKGAWRRDNLVLNFGIGYPF